MKQPLRYALVFASFSMVFVLISLAVTAGLSGVARAATTHVYWSETDGPNGVYRALADGSNEELIHAGGHPVGIYIDGANNRLYWTDTGDNKIYTARANGADAQILYSLTGRDSHSSKRVASTWRSTQSTASSTTWTTALRGPLFHS